MLTLGGVVLILATVSREYSSSWINNIHWSRAWEILPKQEKDTALNTVSTLIKLFKLISFNEYDRTPLISKVVLTEFSLKIYLDRDFNNQLPHKKDATMIDKLTNIQLVQKGELYTVFIKFLLESGKVKYGRAARCCVNFYCEEKQAKTIFEILPCRT
jgi:hypothetical protein